MDGMIQDDLDDEDGGDSPMVCDRDDDSRLGVIAMGNGSASEDESTNESEREGLRGRMDS